MKIIKLQAENIKKLKAIEITPNSNLVKITGKNAQGKTSVLDSIMYALAGKKAIPSKPIRDGEEKASIELDLGDFKILRTFTENGTYLKVTTKDGAEYPKAQDKLSTLVKNISFDPLEFANKNSKEQVEVLTELLGISEQLNELDEGYKKAYEERTVVNRQFKEAQAKLNTNKPDSKYFEMEKIDISEVSDKLEAEREKFQEIEKAKHRVEACEANIDRIQSQIEALQKQLEEEKKSFEFNQREVEGLEAEFDVKVGKELKEQLENATEINEKIVEAQNYTRQQLEVETLRKKANNWDETVKEVIADRTKLITKSPMPIEGLGINDEGIVTYNEIPFEQLSGAERLKVSLSIAMAMNPELRVIRILDGSLLDEDNLKVIEEMATDKDYQVWIEIVTSDSEIGFYIEEGEVKGGK